MHAFLRQSTASQSRTIGPFVDDTDFKTTEGGLTIANTDVKLVKNGAASVNKNAGGGTHRINGDYSITLDATDTDTVGELRVSVDVAGALVAVAKFTVLEEAVYDLLFASGATAQVTPANDSITSAKFALGAIDGDALDGTALTAIGGGVLDEDMTAHQIAGTLGAAIGDPGVSGESIFKAVVTDASGTTVGADTTAIVDDTNTLNTDWADGGRLDLILDATALEASLTDARNRLPAALVGGRMDSNVSAINNSNSAAVQLALSAVGILSGEAVAGTLSTTQATTDLTGYGTNVLKGSRIEWTSGAAAGAKSVITANTSAGLLTFATMNVTPTATDKFVLL